MATAISILREEYKAILKMIDVAEHISERLKKGAEIVSDYWSKR